MKLRWESAKEKKAYGRICKKKSQNFPYQNTIMFIWTLTNVNYERLVQKSYFYCGTFCKKEWIKL